MDCRAANNDVVEGIELMGALFHSNKLYISAQCAHMIPELEGYAYARDKHDRPTESPVKANDHCIDAARYGIYSEELYEGGLPIANARLRLVR
jgi:phage terminase large subunit